MLVEGSADRLQTKLGNKAVIPASLTPGTGSLRVSQVEGEGDEASRAGVRFHLSWSAATGSSPVQAQPTTTAGWLFYVPANALTIVAVMDVLGMWLVSGTAGAGGTLLAAIVGPAQMPSNLTNVSQGNSVITNADAASVKSAKLIVTAGVILTSSPGWAPLAYMNPLNTVAFQTQMEMRDLRGKYVISSGTGLALTVISPAGAAPLFAPYASWREYATDLE